MARICPECQYPNVDKAETCFKCGADITDERLREDRARISVQRRQEREEYRDSQIQSDNEPWSIINFFKLNVDNDNLSFKGINYSNRLLKTIDIFIIIFLVILVLIIITGIFTAYSVPIEMENKRVSLAVIHNRTSRALYESEMQTYNDLVNLQRQLGGNITATPPSAPDYESEEFNPNVKIKALSYAVGFLFAGIIYLLIMLLLYWIIRCIIINNIEHQKALRYNFESMNNYISNLNENVNLIKDYYSNNND